MQLVTNESINPFNRKGRSIAKPNCFECFNNKGF
jgi:hypothetical protein